jgi:hypothetical protein
MDFELQRALAGVDVEETASFTYASDLSASAGECNGRTCVVAGADGTRQQLPLRKNSCSRIMPLGQFDA